MTNIKKLFLSLSLLVARSAFGMDVPQPIQSPDGKKGWVQIRSNADFKPFIDTCVVVRANQFLIRTEPDQYLHISPKRSGSSFYPLCVFHKFLVWGFLPRWNMQFHARFEEPVFQDKHPFLVRRLTREEASDLATGIKRNEFHVTKSHNNQRLLSDTSLRLDCLTSEERKKYLTQQKIYFDSTTLLGIHRFRNSTLSVLPKDVVRLLCELRTADIRRENPVLKFE